MFIFDVSKVTIKAVKLEPVTTGSNNIYKVKFNFNEDDWDGVLRTACFLVGEKSYSVSIYDGDTCTIPSGVFVDENLNEPLYIGVYGIVSGELVIPTCYCYAGRIMQGASPDGEEPSPDPPSPDPDVIERIIEELKEKLNVSDSIPDEEE